MFRFRNCHGISASRKVSKSALVNSGAASACGVTTGALEVGGDGAVVRGEGAGP